jgi:hypothetical protein
MLLSFNVDNETDKNFETMTTVQAVKKMFKNLFIFEIYFYLPLA